MRMRGHTLIWAKPGSWIPGFVWGYKRAGQMEWFMQRYISAVMKHFDYPYVWDVVNEALENDGSIRKNQPFYVVKDFICKAFNWAHEANPKPKLFINDYCVLDAYNWGKRKSDGLYNLVADMKKRGCAVHGVGFQSHITTNYYYDNGVNKGGPGIRFNMQRYAKIGIDVQITEIDVACDNKSGTCSWNNAAK